MTVYQIGTMNTLYNMNRYTVSGYIGNVNRLFLYRDAMGDNKQETKEG